MSDNNGTALAVIDHKPRPRASKVEKLPPAEHLVVPGAILLAAEAVSARNDAGRPWLQGVFLHSKDGVGRATATDGTRMFVASFPLPKDGAPSWLAGGLIISNDGLKPRLSMIAKEHEARAVRISYARGAAKVELTDVTRSIVFQAALSTGTFPDYDRVLQADSFGGLDEDGRPIGREWEPVGINSAYLKHCAEIAKLLDAGLPKDLRSKNGMVVRAYNSNGDQAAPMVFDFSTWPGAILIIMPAKLASPETSNETAALLAPAVKLTVAALRAHATRNRVWAEQTDDPAGKAKFLENAKVFNERIAEVLKRAPGLPALEDQSEAPAQDDASGTAELNEVEDKPAEDEAASEDQIPANDEPKVTRRRVAIKNRAPKRSA